ncbi:MAG: TRAP transporter large permease [OCS116 cluster bacterium]|uniref:TRAP transporter large permease protein n=1 Tax=OCS116 cluster bacterium TaxID=2030921 RepID=A0A2A4Z0E4_9PROT|nr:TRAP transporter large permease [OCS116 cluster bacterium]
MPWYLAFILMIGMVLSLMVARIPVAFAFLLANIIGVYIFMGGHFGMLQLTANASESLMNYSLLPIPLFLLMGELFFHTGVAERVFMVVDKLLGGSRGRLSYVAIGGGTIFSALSGSSLGNVAMMGSTMYPEMKKNGYSDVLSIGPIIATGGLAAIIPPSGLAVVLGSLAGLDVGYLLLAGLTPGLMLAATYALLVFGITRVKPDTAPIVEVTKIAFGEKMKLVAINLLPMVFIIFMVVGLIILGIATPTEAAAFGVVSVMIVAAGFRQLTMSSIWKALTNAMRISGMIFLIILASTTFSQILSISGATRGLVDWVVNIDASIALVLLAMGLVLLVLGAFLEPVGIMMLTIPVFFPLATSFGVDPLWMGVFILMWIELGLATPPFGLALYVMLAATKDKSIIDVSIAVAPYLLCTVLLIVLISIFPEIVLFLPSLIGG